MSRKNFSSLPFCPFGLLQYLDARVTFQIFFTRRPVGRLHQAGGHAFVDRKPLGLELTQDRGI
jgi:hypothetical protein